MISHFPKRSKVLPLLAIGLVAIVGPIGCGPKSITVSGRVTFNGKPLTGGSVILYCQDEQIVRGIIGPDGTYVIPNVPRGVCRVTVKTHTPIPPGFSLKQHLPPVEEGPTPPIVMRSKLQADIAIPERYGIPEESGLTIRVDKAQTIYDIALTP